MTEGPWGGPHEDADPFAENTQLELDDHVELDDDDHDGRGDDGRQASTLHDAHQVFQRWLGATYDLDALDLMLIAAAVERLDGDPLWLLLVSGSGNAKTETVQALDGIGAAVTSTISSPGALLSATSHREKTKDATGGLLREIGERGVLVIKDVTSILSMSREMRGEVLAAIREVYDGRWTRHVGTDGGRTLAWAGRLAVIGAVTTAWDQSHDVIATMGDRFVMLRMDSTTGRPAAGRQAIGNTGSEPQMRAELAQAVAGVMHGMRKTGTTLTEAETDALLAAADLVTLSRTGVQYDYRGDVIDAHAPEMPTRFAKQLAQVIRGGVALGMDRADALRLAIRCARDSMPPLRLAILDDLAANPDSATADVRKRLGKPRATVDRQLQALHMLGVLELTEEETQWAGKPATRWYYRIAEGIDPAALKPKSVPEMSVPPQPPVKRAVALRLPTDKSGTDFEREPDPSTGGTGATGATEGAYPKVRPREGDERPRTYQGLSLSAANNGKVRGPSRTSTDSEPVVRDGPRPNPMLSARTSEVDAPEQTRLCLGCDLPLPADAPADVIAHADPYCLDRLPPWATVS